MKLLKSRSAITKLQATIIAIIIIIAAIVAVYYVTRPSPETEVGPITLTVWVWEYHPPAIEAIKEAVEEWNSLHPDVQVKIESFPGDEAEFKAKVLTAFKTGTAPDIVGTSDVNFCGLVYEGVFTKAPEELINYLKDALLPGYVDLLRHRWADGKMYYDGAVLYESGPFVLYYNKKMFKEAGLDPDKPPRTWDELLEYAKKLTVYDPNTGEIIRSGLSLRLAGHVGGIGDKWHPWLLCAGGRLLTPDGKRAAFNDAHGVAALQFWLDCVYKYRVDAIGIPHDTPAFAAEQTAMFHRRLSPIAYLAENAPDLEYGVAYRPYNDKFVSESYCTSHAHLMGVVSTSPHKEAAWEFLTWLSQYENAKKYTVDIGGFCPYKEAFNYPPYKGNPIYDVIKTVPNVQSRCVHPLISEIYAILGKWVQKAVAENLPAKEALDNAAAEVNELLAEFESS